MPEANNHLLSGATNDSWRTWLMTGARRGRVDRRRLRGAHRGLKQMLIEGAGDPARPHSWREFSDAMVRHSVDEAMQTLPIEEAVMVKLAFFGGFSNREIARELGFNESTIHRRLRDALDKISDYVQRGRTLGRRAVYAVLVWLSARSISDAVHHTIEAAAVAAAATILVVHPAPFTPPAGAAAPHSAVSGRAAAGAVMPSSVVPPAPTPTPLAPPDATGAGPSAGVLPVAPPAPQLPSVPSLPVIPAVHVPPLPVAPPGLKAPKL